MLLDENEDNVVLQPWDTLNTYTTETHDVYYIVYNAVTLTVSVYKDKFKYSCYLFNTTKKGADFINHPEHFRLISYIKTVFLNHQ